MSLSIQNKIKSLFKSYKITPIRFIQGDDSINFLRRGATKRILFKKSTALFEGTFRNNPVIVKVYINLKNNKLRFQREKYCYSTIPRKYPEISQFFPKLYLSNTTPFPFLVLEKIDFPSLGDWYFIREKTTKNEIVSCFKAFKMIHSTIPLPKKLFYTKLTNPNNFFKKNKKIRKTLLLYPALKPSWKALQKNKEKFKRFYSKTGFIFSDFSPSNILAKNSQVKFVDLETVSIGNPFYDLATFTFATLSKKESFQFTMSLINKLFITKKEDLFIFKFFLLWYILFNLHLIPYSSEPYLKLAKKLTQELTKD